MQTILERETSSALFDAILLTAALYALIEIPSEVLLTGPRIQMSGIFIVYTLYH